MAAERSKQIWVMVAVTTCLIAGLTHLAFKSARAVTPSASETRDVSFKVVFDERVGFPQTIRQSTIEKLLGPEYAIVAPRHAAEQPVRERSGEATDSRDCQIEHHGGLLTLRVPQRASSMEIAGRLEQLSRVKSVTIHVNN